MVVFTFGSPPNACMPFKASGTYKTNIWWITFNGKLLNFRPPPVLVTERWTRLWLECCKERIPATSGAFKQDWRCHFISANSHQPLFFDLLWLNKLFHKRGITGRQWINYVRKITMLNKRAPSFIPITFTFLHFRVGPIKQMSYRLAKKQFFCLKDIFSKFI